MKTADDLSELLMLIAEEQYRQSVLSKDAAVIVLELTSRGVRVHGKMNGCDFSTEVPWADITTRRGDVLRYHCDEVRDQLQKQTRFVSGVYR